MAPKAMSREKAIAIGVVVLIVFALLTLVELWVVKWMGFDVIAHLQVSKKEGGTQFFFEAFGVVAFILFQPAVLVWLLLKMVKNFAANLVASFTSWLK